MSQAQKLLVFLRNEEIDLAWRMDQFVKLAAGLLDVPSYRGVGLSLIEAAQKKMQGESNERLASYKETIVTRLRARGVDI